MTLGRKQPKRLADADTIVGDALGRRIPKPCDPHSGRPLDQVARSWWDAGFRVVGYRPPPKELFRRFVRQLRRDEQRADRL